MRNYLLRLGWSHGDQEIFSTDEMIAAFDLPQIGRAPARFDFSRLESLNGHYIRQASDQALVAAIEGLLPHIAGGADIATKITPAVREKIIAAMPGLKERAKTLLELIESARFVFSDRPISLDEKARALVTPEARKMLAALRQALAAVPRWEVEPLEAAVRACAEEAGVKLGVAAQPLRAALTGRSTSPGIFDVLTVLGREESLARVSDLAA
jgi:glutamyl-tRNA synthetase